MRKIVVGEFLSLDGVMEAPDKWHFPYLNEEMGAAIMAQLDEADTLLLGRVTYESYAGSFPGAPADDPLAARLNDAAKYVVSTSLKEARWRNSTIISGAVVEQVARLKRQAGKNINVTGSAAVVELLSRAGLIDEYRLLVHPIVLGEGKRLFEEGVQQKLTLVDSRTFANGVLYLTYQPER